MACLLLKVTVAVLFVAARLGIGALGLQALLKEDMWFAMTHAQNTVFWEIVLGNAA